MTNVIFARSAKVRNIYSQTADGRKISVGVEIADILQSATYLELHGRHNEIRALAYRLIEEADKVQAEEWQARVDAYNATEAAKATNAAELFTVVGSAIVEIDTEEN